MKTKMKLAVHLDNQLYMYFMVHSENFSIPSLIILFILMISFLLNSESAL